MKKAIGFKTNIDFKKLLDEKRNTKVEQNTSLIFLFNAARNIEVLTNKLLPAFREYFEVFRLFHLTKISHGTKKEQKNVALDDLPDREGVQPPKQGGKGERGTRKGGCRRNQRWKSAGGRVGSLRRGCILRFTLGYLARSIGKGMDFSTTRPKVERGDGSA